MLRLAAHPGSYLTGHVFVRLVDAKTGFACVGINFKAQPVKGKVSEPNFSSGQMIHEGRENCEDVS